MFFIEVRHVGKLGVTDLHWSTDISGVRLSLLQSSSMFVLICPMRVGVGSREST